jgi:hypothetical protein
VDAIADRRAGQGDDWDHWLEMAIGKVAIARGAGVRGDRVSPSLADLQEESELGK